MALHERAVALPLRVPSGTDALMQSPCSQPNARVLNVHHIRSNSAAAMAALDKMQDTEMAGVHEPVAGASGVFELS